MRKQPGTHMTPAAKVATRMRLMLATEALVATEGLDRVSTRAINRAAGQRNASAIRYHFGSIDKLLEAVLEFRAQELSRRQIALLHAAGENCTTRQLVRIIVVSTMEKSAVDSGGGTFVGFVAQLLAHPRYAQTAATVLSSNQGSANLRRMLATNLPQLPAPIIDARFAACLAHAAIGIAQLLRTQSTATGAATIPIAVGNLVDSLTASLAAPVSAETTSEIERNNRRTA